MNEISNLPIDFRTILDEIPALAWSGPADGPVDFINQRWFATATDIEDRKRAEDLMRSEAVALREQIDRDSMFENIVGSSEALRKVLRQVAKVAPCVIR